MEEPRKFGGMSLEELEAQRVELLPDREEMQTFGDVTFGDIATGDQLAVQIQGVQEAHTSGDVTFGDIATGDQTIIQLQGVHTAA